LEIIGGTQVISQSMTSRHVQQIIAALPNTQTLREGLIQHLGAKIEFPHHILRVQVTSHHSQGDMWYFLQR